MFSFLLIGMANLSSQHFQLVNTRGNNELRLRVPGPFVVLFKMSSCDLCNSQAIPAIQTLANNMGGTPKFGIIDVGQYRDVATSSQSTSTPVKSVPHIIFYMDGKPHSRYKGSIEYNSIRSFIIKMMQTLSGPPMMQAPPPQQHRGVADFSRSFGNSPAGGGLQTRGGKKYYTPEMDVNPNNMRGIKGGGLPQHMEDKDEKLLLPENITPKNRPWEGVVEETGYD